MPYWGGIAQDPMGIEHDFASGIAKELGISLHYRGFDTIEDLLNAVKVGKADMAIGFGQTPSREGKFLFSEPLYENVRVIWLRDKAMEDQPFERLKWVCIQGTSYCEVLKSRGYPNILMARNYNSSAEMVRQGVADATITNYVSLNHFLSKNRLSLGKVIFDPSLGTQTNRILINTHHPLLLSSINKVLLADKNGLTKNKLNSADVYFLNDQANLKILRNENVNPVVRYTIQDDFFPISYWDDREGKYKGYIHDLLERISAKSILKFEFVPAYGRDVEDMLQQGKVDLIPFFNRNYLDDRYFIDTGKFTDIEFGYIETTKPYTTQTVGILDRTGKFSTYIDAQQNLANVKVYRTVYDLEQALDKGDITHGLLYKVLINQMLFDGYQNSFKLMPKPIMEDQNLRADITMLVRKDARGLQNMLQKVLATFSPQEIDEIKTAYDRVTVQFGYDKQKVLIYSLVTICILLIVGLAVTLLLTRLRLKLRSSQEIAKLSAEQLRWLTELLDAIPSMIFISDANGEVVLTNAAYRQNHQVCSNNDCFNQRPDCSFIDLPEEVNAEFSLIIQAPEARCSIGGHYFHVIRRAISHPINHGQYYLTLFNDITELKETEQALRQSNEQALQAVEARNHFLAVVSHELRTPIAAMLGLMEILASRLKSSENQLLLTNAISSAERLKLHVNDILDFSKIEAEQLKLDIATYNLADELGPLLRGFEARAQLNQVEFDVIWLPNPLLVVDFDALRFNQIVTNLLSNAIKFTEQGRVVVKVDVTPEQLNLVVEDSGCGMTQQQIDSIFVPFVQADSTITRRFGGTGLGMSIVANLIELMQGRIDITSQFGQGTQVSVSIPVATQPCHEFQDQVLALSYRSPYLLWAKALGIRVQDGGHFVDQNSHNIYPDLLLNMLREVANDASEKIEPTQSRLLKGHVLVADDDAINRLLMRKQLSELGLSATLVNDGRQALEALLENPQQYDLLITDCHMPNLDGFALTRKVKQEITQFQGAVIGCTAEDSRFAAEQAQQAGMDKVIYKPYTLANLRKVLSRYLSAQVVNTAQRSWLDTYQEDEREEMAIVVVESLSQDIALLNQPECDVKALAHRIKGAAGSLQLQQLADLAKTVEKQNDPQQLIVEKQQLINAMHEVIEQAQQWLNDHQSE
ncbi:hybrid sensor histidine kinase/response regulator [Vibrio metoecus]|uniref:hybrid sensor histidine kinase/response regulator n=1 Tax=Vibrio metoecus TaxID=1481663 RepID=UPI00215D27BA|nr:transporter substrate-binding domain-containing protein [Vibrio metoecus]MCR9388653.1 transporter substrate-binding domain-containing protein [Vibrio metoecus]